MKGFRDMKWMGMFAAMVLVSFWVVSAAAAAGDLPEERLVRTLRFVAYSPGEEKNIAEAHKFIASQVKKLGFQIDFKPMLRSGVLQNMWFTREFDLGTLWLTGRPTRVDPNMILYKLYHSEQDRPNGYNWAGYHNPEYDGAIDASAAAMDQEERKKLIWKCQELAARDVPILTLVHQMNLSPYNNKKWTGFVNMVGNGLKNVWSWTQAKPLTDDKTLVVGYHHDGGVLSPLTAHESNLMVCRTVYDTLVKVGPDGHPKPWLAESWKYISPTIVEFRLRKGHKFHDGKPLTAEDVKFTFDYILSKKIAYHYDACKVIKETEIIDDYTVRLILHHPFAPLLGHTGEQVFILPKHIWKDVPEKTKVDKAFMWAPAPEGKLIGSGFLRFAHWRKGDEVKLEVNRDHFFAPAYDARILKFVPSPEAMLGRLKKGELDIIADYPYDGVPLKKLCDADPNLSLTMEPSVGWYELAFNCRKPPLDDVVVRRAIAAVIPRDVIAKNIWKGFAIPAYTPTHPMLKPWYFSEAIRWEEKGLKGAKEMLTEAGYRWDSEGRIYYPEGKTN